jgi:transcriptional regulator of NAD metabolism
MMSFAADASAEETREEFLESLRQSHAEMMAGERGRSVDEVFAAMDRELANRTMDQQAGAKRASESC